MEESGSVQRVKTCHLAILVLTHKVPPVICSRRQFQILLLFQNLQIKNDDFMRFVCWQTILMKYHSLFFFENLEMSLADNSHEILFLIFFEN